MITINLKIYRVTHQWAMTEEQCLRAAAIAVRRLERKFGIKVKGATALTNVPEPPITQQFEFESQVSGYMMQKLHAIYPNSDGALSVYLIRPVEKPLQGGGTTRAFYGAAWSVGEIKKGKTRLACACSSSVFTRAPTPFFLSGIMMAHEVAHLLGASHDPSNTNIMEPTINNYSGYQRRLTFNPLAQREVRECLKAAGLK